MNSEDSASDRTAPIDKVPLTTDRRAGAFAPVRRVAEVPEVLTGQVPVPLAQRFPPPVERTEADRQASEKALQAQRKPVQEPDLQEDEGGSR